MTQAEQWRICLLVCWRESEGRLILRSRAVSAFSTSAAASLSDASLTKNKYECTPISNIMKNYNLV